MNDAKNVLSMRSTRSWLMVIFGGRLGEYKYYDMDQVIAAVLDRCETELND